MSDTRFIMLGISLTFAGFIMLGIFGSNFAEVTIQTNEFGDCFEYFEDSPPIPVDCEMKTREKIVFIVAVIGLITAGIISLIKGVKGKWDQNVRPEDMVGPGSSDSK